MHFMKNRQKRYCEDSGLLTKDEMDDYSRMQLLKNVQKSLPHMQLSKDQEKVQALKLRVIEETPLEVPTSRIVQS